MSAWSQEGYRLRLGWGLMDAVELTGGIGEQLVVVVDVLSFSTTVSVAADLGIEVWPYRWRDASAYQFAIEHDAQLAVGRGQVKATEVSLSPASLRRASGLRRLVLPSPNGATIAQAIGHRHTIVAASLRNFEAVADLLDSEMQSQPRLSLTVIAAGEQWTDGTLRPAVEDLWGAGAVLSAVLGQGLAGVSPEARAAIAAYRDAAPDLPDLLRRCVSGQELTASGYPEDVEVAAEVASSRSIPVLLEGRFVNTA